VSSYNYLKKQKLIKEKRHDEIKPEKGTQLRGRIPKPFYGVLPLCYVSWLCYASYLVFKISYLFKNEVVNLLDKQDIFGPQLLKLAVSISTVIFILLVAAHHDAEKDSQRALGIKALCHGTAFELLDSMAFLSILIVRESHLIVSYDFENVVLAFACLNYFLPAIGLYQLCLSDFGQRGKTLELDGVYHLSHLVLVNVPYLAVRIYLWSGFGSDISMFVMKNVIAIVYSLKEIVPDLMTLHRQCRGRQAVTEPAKCAEEALELEPNH